MPEVKPSIESLAKIKVVGVGGAGGSAVNRMISANIKGVDFVAVNTDLQALQKNKAPHKVHIGKQLTKGLGAGMNPDVGRSAAEEAQNELRDMLKGADMVFITCGLGGGTGSGAGPVIAQIAKELGALTIAVVTKPFSFEQAQRMEIAEAAHDEFIDHVDTIITIHNDRVLEIIDAKKTPIIETFRVIDDVLRQGVQGISEVITTSAEINVDFADVRTIMKDAGSALMGMGIGTGENRAQIAAKAAIASPLLNLDVDGAKGILFMITGGRDLGTQEVYEAANIITGSADENAKVIFGASIDDNMKDEIRITVIATGFAGAVKHQPQKTLEKLTFGRSSFSNKSTNELSESDSEITKKRKSIFESPFTKKKDTRPQMRVEPVIPKSLDFAKIEDDADDIKIIEQSDSKLINSDEEDLEIPAFLRKKIG